MEFLQDPRIWTSAAFVVFIVLMYKKVMKFALDSLDTRSNKIKLDLDQAAQLRGEAEKLLAEYRRKQAEYIKEAEDMLESARSDAQKLTAQAEIDLKVSLDARMKSAMAKIAQEEERAIADVRNHVVDIALGAARSVITQQAATLPQDEQVKIAIADLDRKLH